MWGVSYARKTKKHRCSSFNGQCCCNPWDACRLLSVVVKGSKCIAPSNDHKSQIPKIWTKKDRIQTRQKISDLKRVVDEQTKKKQTRPPLVASTGPFPIPHGDDPPLPTTGLPSTPTGTPTNLATEPNQPTPLLLRVALLLLLLLLLPPGLGF